MGQKDEFIAAAQGKVDEATFFLAKMREAHVHPHLDEADHQFGWYFSAFLCAARSAPQVITALEKILKESDKHKWAWADRAMNDWGDADKELYNSFTTLRNESIHEGEGGVGSELERVTESEMLSRFGNRLDKNIFITEPLGLDKTPWIYEKNRLVLKIGNQTLPPRECAEKYLSLVKLMLDHYKSAPISPSV